MPLIAVYKKDVALAFNRCLEQDERRLRIAIKKCKSKNVVLEEADAFTTMNVNTKTELKAFKNAYNH